MRVAFLSLAGLCLAASAGSAAAAESYDGCTHTIASLPAILGSQGTWCLASDFSTSMASGTAITITANNITIDCNGHKLGGLSAGLGTQAVGIGATGRLNATVRRCTIRGFAVGVDLGGFGHLVEDSTFDANRVAGIRVDGGDAVIRRNRVNNTGGNTLSLPVTGIATTGASDIVDNTIVGVFTADGVLPATAIVQLLAPSGTVAGNRIHVVAASDAAQGIQSVATGPVAILRNDVLGPGAGDGIVCSPGAILASRNVVAGFDVAQTDCEDAGDNDFGTIAP